MSLRIKTVVDKFVEELKEALDADIQDRIMKEREMQSYIQEREREVAEREAAWKAELSRREVTPFPFLCFSLFPISHFPFFCLLLRLSITIITNSCLTIQKSSCFDNQVASFFAVFLFIYFDFPSCLN